MVQCLVARAAGMTLCNGDDEDSQGAEWAPSRSPPLERPPDITLLPSRCRISHTHTAKHKSNTIPLLLCLYFLPLHPPTPPDPYHTHATGPSDPYGCPQTKKGAAKNNKTIKVNYSACWQREPVRGRIEGKGSVNVRAAGQQVRGAGAS